MVGGIKAKVYWDCRVAPQFWSSSEVPESLVYLKL